MEVVEGKSVVIVVEKSCGDCGGGESCGDCGGGKLW